MRGWGKKGLLFLLRGSSRSEKEGFFSSNSRGGGFGGRGVGFFGTGCGQGFLGVAWGCSDGQKMEPFSVGVGVGAGVPAGSWKDGVSSAGVGSYG